MGLLNIFFLSIAYAVEPVIWIFTLSKVFTRKYKNKFPYMLCWLGSYIIICIKQYVGIKEMSSILEILLFIGLILYYFITYGKIFVAKKTNLIISLSIFFVFALVSEFIIMGLATVVGIPGKDLVTIGPVNTCLTLLSKVILFGICHLLIWNRSRWSFQSLWNIKEIIPILLGLIIVEMPIIFLFRNMSLIEYEIGVLVLFVFAQVVLVLLAVYMIIFVIRHVNAEQELKNSMYQTQAEISAYKQYEEKLEELNQTRHDLKSHIGIIKQLCEQKDYEELEQYFEELYGKIEISEYFIIENKNVEILLNQMRKQILEKKINFIHKIMAEKLGVIDDLDICSLLSNILKNAMEATEQLPIGERYIKFTMQENEDGVEIYCENTYSIAPIIRHGEYITTKDEGHGHGYGVKIIQKISKKYKGNARIDHNKELFNVRVYIPYR